MTKPPQDSDSGRARAVAVIGFGGPSCGLPDAKGLLSFVPLLFGGGGMPAASIGGVLILATRRPSR
jgi:hypothetical protein